MKTKLFALKKHILLKDEQTNKILLKITTEVGAWILAGGFFLGIYWIGGIIF